MESKIHLSTTIHFIERWQLLIVLLICAVSTIAVISFRLIDHHGVSGGQEIMQVGTSSIKVKAGENSPLNPNVLTADSPPTKNSASLQSPYNPDNASAHPIQSNVNINDTSMSSNPLVESLLTGQ